MSLAALAIRACTFLSLYGHTLAEARVYDSALSSIEELMKAEQAPFITIAIDEANTDPRPATGHDLLSSIDKLLLVVELAISSRVDVAGQDGEDVATVTIPDTEPALEWALDIMTHQVMRRLTTDDVWGDLWRRFVMAVASVTRLRGGVAEGRRMAARQIIIEVQPISDPDVTALAVPEPGDTGSPWVEFLAALRALDADADPEMAAYIDLADAVEAAIRAPAMADWKVAAARLGISNETADAIGLVPVEGDALSVVSLLGEDVGADRIDEVLPPEA